MWRKIVISALIAAILLTASCIPWGAAVPIRPPGITGDNSGGAIVTYAVYETLTEQDYYVQRISPEGDFLWGERGVLIGSTGNGCPYSKAVSDGSGGAIVTWGECLPEVPGEPPSCQTYAARIDSEGNVEWRKDIPGAAQAIPDGSGGVIIAFDDPYGNISVLKIDAEGNLPWGEDGVSLNLPGAYLCSIASDNSGGVIVVENTFQGDPDAVYAQRVDSQGNILWGSGGAQVFVSPAEGADVVSDGAGGAIIAYIRDIPCEDGEYGSCDLDIYAQRIDAEGNVLWGPDGVPICVGASLPHPFSSKIVADGAGGAIIFWVDERGVCAQRVDADGHKLWNEDVELLATPSYYLVSDGSGGAICVWCGGGGISAAAQGIDATGTKLWGPDGTTLTMCSNLVVSDGCGGVLISWSADVKFRNYEVSDVSYYVQRIDADGDVVWGDEGILLDP